MLFDGGGEGDGLGWDGRGGLRRFFIIDVSDGRVNCTECCGVLYFFCSHDYRSEYQLGLGRVVKGDIK